MASIHIGTVTLTNANAPLSLASGLSGIAAVRTMARQLFIQGNAAFSVGSSAVTATTGLQCSPVNAVGAAQNAPHTPVFGTTAAQPIINLAEVFVVSSTGGAVVTFLWIA
jgi:hypothetical protein